MNDELRRQWKELVIGCFNSPSDIVWREVKEITKFVIIAGIQAKFLIQNFSKTQWITSPNDSHILQHIG
jgi:hypothetical protein